jgi:hypothetical protein
MTKPETKVVLKRTFTWNAGYRSWQCELKGDRLLSLFPPSHKARVEHWTAELNDEGDETLIDTATGPTETDAILALQSQLRKMAELEVVE